MGKEVQDLLGFLQHVNFFHIENDSRYREDVLRNLESAMYKIGEGSVKSVYPWNRPVRDKLNGIIDDSHEIHENLVFYRTNRPRNFVSKDELDYLKGLWEKLRKNLENAPHRIPLRKSKFSDKLKSGIEGMDKLMTDVVETGYAMVQSFPETLRDHNSWGFSFGLPLVDWEDSLEKMGKKAFKDVGLDPLLATFSKYMRSDEAKKTLLNHLIANNKMLPPLEERTANAARTQLHEVSRLPKDAKSGLRTLLDVLDTNYRKAYVLPCGEEDVKDIIEDILESKEHVYQSLGIKI
jgi:hypothetical protein